MAQIINYNSDNGFKSFINGLLKYDSFIIFGGFILVILSAIFITILYDQADNMRQNVLFNNALAIGMGLFFIYLIFTFMGQSITILKIKIDLGLILFLSLGICIVFVLGD